MTNKYEYKPTFSDKLESLWFNGWFMTGVVITSISLILFGLFSFMFYISRWECDAQTRGMKYSHRWSAIGGCQINTSDGWINLELYRKVD